MGNDDPDKKTSIPVSAGVRDELAADKPANTSWDDYLEGLHEAAPIDGDTRVVDIDELEATLSESLTVEIPAADVREAAREGSQEALERVQ